MKRNVGVLLSITSLPSKYGIGCFSKAAYDFVDWLEAAGQRYWQILPLGATSHTGAFDSPYQAYSAFAGNPYFICLETLVEEGVLTQEECDAVDFGSNPAKVDYDALAKNRLPLLHKAYERSNISLNPKYQQFIRENFWWLDDYALFIAVKNFFGGDNWTTWPQDIRMHWDNALNYYREKLYFDVEFQKYLQFKFDEQWTALKAYANSKHIEIVGDIPIYVSPDGSDVWAHPEMFQLDESNQPTQIAGCPPDAFAADGQIWGNPLYRWDYHKSTGFQWWVTRLWHSFKLYDVVRIDHFRGFDEYFAIPSGATSAKAGHWEKGPGMDLFNTIRANLGQCQVIAEDLGLMTEGVRQLVLDSGFPNMKVLQFAFDSADIGGSNEYLPHNYGSNCVVYTGTHDNETLAGWLASLNKTEKDWVSGYLGREGASDEELCKGFMVTAMMCPAKTCIVAMQDHLRLDNTTRMNVPGTVDVNWSWRLKEGQVTEALGKELLDMAMRFGRANWDSLNAKAKREKAQTAAEAVV